MTHGRSATAVVRTLFAAITLTIPLTSVAQPTVVTGPGSGGTPQVKVFEGSSAINDFFAYTPTFTGGVTVAHADVNGDGMPDLITGTATGGAHVKVFNGATNAELHSFIAYTGFTGGVFVAGGDVNGDGFDDIITGAGSGGPPHVKVFSGVDLSLLASFFATTPAFTGGIRVAAGDFDGDKLADIITGTGPGTAGQVRVFRSYDQYEIVPPFTPYGSLTNGIWVAAGDLDLDGKAEIVTGSGGGRVGTYSVWAGGTSTGLLGAFVFGDTYMGEVRVAVEISGLGAPRIVAAKGPGYASYVLTHPYPPGDATAFAPYDPAFTGGVYVGAFDTKPTATIVGDSNACGENDGSISVLLTGRAPWTLHWSDGATSSDVYISPFTRSVSVPGTYTITRVEDLNHPTGKTEGEAVVAAGSYPVFSAHPASQTIIAGQTANLSATASGGGTITYQWFEGTPGNSGVIVGATSATYTTPPLLETTAFHVVASNGTCTTASNTATVTVQPLAAPTLTATASSTSAVAVTWTAVTGASQYELQRNSGGGYATIATLGGLSFNDTGRAASSSFVYRVRALGGGGAASAYSTADVATTIMFTDPSLSAGTPVRVVHINELRTAALAFLGVAGIASEAFTDTIEPGVPVKAVHVSEIRSAVSAARSWFGLPALSWTDASLDGATVKAVHITQLRNAVR